MSPFKNPFFGVCSSTIQSEKLSKLMSGKKVSNVQHLCQVESVLAIQHQLQANTCPSGSCLWLKMEVTTSLRKLSLVPTVVCFSRKDRASLLGIARGFKRAMHWPARGENKQLPDGLPDLQYSVLWHHPFWADPG